MIETALARAIKVIIVFALILGCIVAVALLMTYAANAAVPGTV